MLVVGGREQEANSVAVRLHGKGRGEVRPRDEAIADILQRIRTRSGD
jgi:threonyl-tRNA synthetase